MVSALLAAFLLQATYIDLYNEGHRLMDEGRFREAEKVLQEADSLNPSHVPTLKSLAEVYVKTNHLDEAIEVYRKIIALNQKDMTSWGHLGELYSWKGDYDKSIVTYRDALDIDPANSLLKTGLAKVLRWSHRYEEAERLYKDVLQADPENHEALKGLAKTMSMTGDLTGSVELLRSAIGLYPDDPELYKELGTVLGWQKDYKTAVESLNKSIQLAPKYVDAWRTLGDVYLWMKSYKQAVDAYKKAIDLEPDKTENHILVARTYLQMGDNSSAESSVLAALKLDPSDAQALDLLREIRGTDELKQVKRIGDVIEFTAFVFVCVLLFLTYKSRKRVLLRRHRLYFYFTNLVLPVLVVTTSVAFLTKDSLSNWLDQSVIEDLTEAFLFSTLGTSFIALLWTEKRSHDFSNMSVLVIGAHPDDVELGCGGFIMKAKDSGAKVYALTMTRGEKGTDKIGVREEELGRSAKFMQLDGFWIYDFPDTGLRECIPAMKDAIEGKIKELNATMVLTHTHMDIHSDHQAVFEASKVAARNISMLCYEDVSTPREFVPNYFIDITGYIEDKLKLVSFHRTQGDKTYMDPEVIKGRAAHRGIQSGVQYAEAYWIYKLLR